MTAYISAQRKCWKCGKETTVWTWRGHSLWPDKLPEGEAVPAELSLGSTVVPDHQYWLNRCSHCGRVQGDFYLYMEPDGPFFGRGVWDVVDGMND